MGFAEKLNNLLAGKGFREDDTKKKSKSAARREKKKKAEAEFWRGEDDMDLMTKMAMLNNDWMEMVCLTTMIHLHLTLMRMAFLMNGIQGIVTIRNNLSNNPHSAIPQAVHPPKMP